MDRRDDVINRSANIDEKRKQFFDVHGAILETTSIVLTNVLFKFPIDEKGKPECSGNAHIRNTWIKNLHFNTQNTRTYSTFQG